MPHSSIQNENLKKAPREIKINGEVYSTIAPEAIQVSKWLVDIWIKLGKPQTPFTESGAKMMDVIIASWEDLYPVDSQIWYNERKDHLKAELSITEQVHKHTGRSLASFPYPIFRMMKVVFKNFKVAERKNCIKMVGKWKMFKMVNKV